MRTKTRRRHKIQCQNILNQLNRVSSFCLCSHFVISLTSTKISKESFILSFIISNCKSFGESNSERKLKMSSLFYGSLNT